MQKILLVFRNELINVITRRSFLLVLVLIPLVSFSVLLVTSLLQKNGAAPSFDSFVNPPAQLSMQGYVDESGLLRVLPADDTNLLKKYDSEAQARQALSQGDISSYYIIPVDYLKTGLVRNIRPDFNPMAGVSQSSPLTNALEYNLLGANTQLYQQFNQPMKMQTEYLNQKVQRDPENALTFFLPYSVTFLFYILILSSSTLMLNSITSEKQNRVMEILMTSMTPTQMLTGKIMALGVAGLLQTVVLSLTGFGLLRLGGQTFNLPASFQLPPSILIWGILFFLTGFAVYASLMAGLGALVPNLREASQATMLVIFPLIIPLMLISSLINKPDDSLSVGLSIFPLTAPIAMMTRLAATQVPIWQVLLSLGLVILTALLIIRSVAGMFRAQNLLSGQSFKVKLFLKALIGRA
jgi:ABC-2 type transport system permease protein